MTGLVRSAALVAAAAIIAALPSQGAIAKDVSLRFSWKLKGEYAFFYLGQEKGLYKDAGINLRLGEGAGAQAALGALLQGQEDVAVVPGVFAITAIQKGMPVKIIALYQPAAPVVLLSHQDNPVRNPADLEGKSIASSVGETSTAYLDVFCRKNKIDCGKIKKIQMNAQSRIPEFVQKKVDAVGVYRSSDFPVIKEKLGNDFSVLDMTAFGLEVPGLAVVASDNGIEKNADVLRRFLSVTSRAIEAARSDPDAAATVLKAVWQAGPSEAIIREQVEATSQSIPTATGKPLGWIDEKAITDALALIGSIERIGEPKPASSFYTNKLLTE